MNDDIKRLRWKRHLSVLEVAIPLCISPFTYVDYEDGRKKIPEDTKKRIINFLSIDESETDKSALK